MTEVNPIIWMHLDVNSCFATLEQQSQPHLRHRPIAVAAYTTNSGCILAPSIEAKQLGIKTGMKVGQAKKLCPQLRVLSPDVAKYQDYHRQLRQLLETYFDQVSPQSIDEFAVDVSDQLGLGYDHWSLSQAIKQDIRRQVGNYISVSIGFGANRFQAKLAAGLIKPDGYYKLDSSNLIQTLSKLELTDLPGIAQANARRLHLAGISKPVQMYQANLDQLKTAFGSKVAAYTWWYRLHDRDREAQSSPRKSFGNSYSPPQNITTPTALLPILSKLVTKCCFRMRRAGFATGHLSLKLSFYQQPSQFQHLRLADNLSQTNQIFKQFTRLLDRMDFNIRVRNVAVTCGQLIRQDYWQPDLFSDHHQHTLTRAIDQINQKYGQFCLVPAQMLKATDLVPERISFGKTDQI